MSGWLQLDRMAAASGDGLAPALRNLLIERAMMADPSGKIVDIAALRKGELVQAGPSPTKQFPRHLPANVVAIAKADCVSQEYAKSKIHK